MEIPVEEYIMMSAVSEGWLKCCKSWFWDAINASKCPPPKRGKGFAKSKSEDSWHLLSSRQKFWYALPGLQHDIIKAHRWHLTDAMVLQNVGVAVVSPNSRWVGLSDLPWMKSLCLFISDPNPIFRNSLSLSELYITLRNNGHQDVNTYNFI